MIIYRSDGTPIAETKVLYDNAKGSNRDILLSDKISNYKKIDIFVKRTTFEMCLSIGSNTTECYLTSQWINDGPMQLEAEKLTFITANEKTTIKRGTRYYRNLNVDGKITSGSDTTLFLITKVVGYNY